MRRSDALVAVLLFAAVTAVTLVASRAQGLTRDEAYYMDAGQRYTEWMVRVARGELAPLDRDGIAHHWAYNREHPPLMKVLYGLSWRALHRCDCARYPAMHPSGARLHDGRHATLGLLDEVDAFRLPAAACLGGLAALLYVLGRRWTGSRGAGLVAAALMVAQPRAFFHAQTAAFDLPVALFWLAGLAAWGHALRRRTRGSAILLGVVFGLFLLTKLQALFLPPLLAAHWLWLRFRSRGARAAPPPLRPLAALAVAGPVVLFAGWPWLWHAPIARFAEYLSFHWHHVHYHFEYLGEDLVRPPFPWHVPLVQLATTAPVTLLALAGAGAALLCRRPRLRDGGRGLRALLLLGALVPLLPFLTGRAPVYGATKHWLGTMPVLALLAGHAAARLCAALARRGPRRRPRAVTVAALVALLSVGPAVAETAASHPYGLSHYNALAGGAPGGADLGMNRQFWGYAVLGAFPWMNAELPPGARVHFHDANRDSWEIYRRTGRLRDDLAYAPLPVPRPLVSRTEAALVVHERHFLDIELAIWTGYGHARPAHVLTLDGVPLVTVYRRPTEQRR